MPFKDSSAAKHFQLLSPSQRNAFKKWLQSSWHNSNKKLLKLYSIMLSSTNNKFTEPIFLDEKLFKKLYKNKAFNKQMLSNLQSQLVKQIKNFLIHTQLSQDEALQLKLLNQAYKQNQQNKQNEHKSPILKITSKTINVIEQKTNKEWTDYADLANAYKSLYDHCIPAKPNSPQAAQYFSKTEKYADLAYAITKLKIMHEKKIGNPHLPKNGISPKIDIVLAKKLFNSNPQNPIVQLYFFRLSYKKLSLHNFLAFKKKYLKRYDTLPPSEKHDLLKLAINDAIRLIEQKETRAAKHLIHLYRFGLDSKTLTPNNNLSLTAFQNIVLITSNIGKQAFAKTFIQEYTHLLPPDFQKDAAIWANAQILYTEGKPKQALKTALKTALKVHKHKNIGLAIAYKSTILKAYFDIALLSKNEHDIEQFKKHCNSYSKFIRNSKLIPSSLKEKYLNFISCALKLKTILGCKIRQPDLVENEKNKMKRKIEKEQHITGQQWLLSSLAKI